MLASPSPMGLCPYGCERLSHGDNVVSVLVVKFSSKEVEEAWECETEQQEHVFLHPKFSDGADTRGTMQVTKSSIVLEANVLLGVLEPGGLNRQSLV